MGWASKGKINSGPKYQDKTVCVYCNKPYGKGLLFMKKGNRVCHICLIADLDRRILQVENKLGMQNIQKTEGGLILPDKIS